MGFTIGFLTGIVSMCVFRYIRRSDELHTSVKEIINEGKSLKKLYDLSECAFIDPTGYGSFYDYKSGKYTSKTFEFEKFGKESIFYSQYYSNSVMNWLGSNKQTVIYETDNVFIVYPLWICNQGEIVEKDEKMGMRIGTESRYVIVPKKGNKDEDKELLNKILDICNVGE